MTDDVQPVEAGQGDEGSQSGLYDLDSVPPELREQLTPHLKAIEANATKKFQEAADYRKGWEPYEELGVKDIDPEQLQGLLSFAEMAQDPDAFNQWVTNYAQEAGLFGAGGDEGSLETDEELDHEGVKKLISEAVTEATQPLTERLTQQEQQHREAEVYQDISEQLGDIRQENPDLPEGAEDAILKFAYAYAEDEEDPIAKGFEDYKAIVAQGENGLFKQKSGQPSAPEGPGAASTSPERITSFDEASKAAVERLRAANTT